jgi:hypothetical protein
MTGVHKCLLGRVLRSLTLPARLAEGVYPRSGGLIHAEFGFHRAPQHHLETRFASVFCNVIYWPAQRR